MTDAAFLSNMMNIDPVVRKLQHFLKPKIVLPSDGSIGLTTQAAPPFPHRP